LATRDEAERDDEFGQNVGETFPMADFSLISAIWTKLGMPSPDLSD
jgi:hypothetical protein